MELLLLFPTEMERDGVLSAMGPGPRPDSVVIGVGPVAAGVSTAVLLSRELPDLLILAGAAGAYRGNPGGVAVGDVCVAGWEVLADLARCISEGLAPLEIGGGPVAGPIPLEADLAAAEALLGRPIPGARVPMATVSCASGDPARAAEVARWSRAWVENMEGAAVAQAARRLGCRLLEVRGVSNWAGEVDHSRWRMEEALQGVGRFLRLLLRPEEGE